VIEGPGAQGTQARDTDRDKLRLFRAFWVAYPFVGRASVILWPLTATTITRIVGKTREKQMGNAGEESVEIRFYANVFAGWCDLA
jgi:hypothetical protein